MEDNNRLRDANGRLTISYGKLKTDYNQIVDDLRTLKNKYNTFKVDHAKTEARLRQFQSESRTGKSVGITKIVHSNSNKEII